MINKTIEAIGLEVKNIEEVPESFSSTVCKLTLESNEEVILKIPYNKSKLLREKVILDKLQGILPVPEVIGVWKGNQEITGALILSLLEGAPITGDIDESLAYDLGVLLAELHSISMNNYSLLDNPSLDWWESVDVRFMTWVNEATPMVEAVYMAKAIRVFKQLINEMDEADGPVLVHFDFRPGNVLIKDNKITGLIDFESSRGGASDIDFTKVKVYIWDKFPNTKTPFLKGYASIRPVPNIEKSLILYELFNGIGGLAWCVRRNQFDDEFWDENYMQVKNIIDQY